jgi:hypothetical protein
MKNKNTPQDPFTPSELDPVEQAICDTFNANAAEISRHSLSGYEKSTGYLCARSEASQVSEASCSFNLLNAHITTELLKEICTSSEPSGACWRFNISDFGDGVVESVASKQLEPLPKRRKIKMDQDDFYMPILEDEPDEKTIRKSQTIEDMDEEQFRRSVGRSRKLARHRALMLKCDRLITFTYRKNQTDRDQCYKDLAATIRRYKRRTKKEFHYVAALEVQERGAYHVHLTTNEFHDVNELRECWHKVTDDDGNVNVKKNGNKDTFDAAAIVAYITKYITKDANLNKLAKKRFSSSRKIPEPTKHTFFLPITLDIDDSDNSNYSPLRILRALTTHLTGGELESFYDVPNSSAKIVFCKSY